MANRGPSISAVCAMPQPIYLNANPNALAVGGVDGNSGHSGGANRRAFRRRFHGVISDNYFCRLTTTRIAGFA